MQVRNVFIIFIVSGFWHGANWTYLAWGFLNGLYFLPLLLLKRNRTNIENPVLSWNLSSVRVFINIVGTFVLSCVAWVFFRAKTVTDAILYLKGALINGNFKSQYLDNERYNYEIVLLLVVFIAVEWQNKTKVEPISGKYARLKLAACLAAIIMLGTYSDYKELIYFQF